MSVNFFTKLALGCLAGSAIASILLLPQPTSAQLTDTQPLQDWQNPETNRDPFSSKGDGSNSSFSMFDMIHRANLAPNRSLGEFSEEQQESLDAAAAEFRQQQRERLESPAQVNPAASQNPVTIPQLGN